MQETGLWAAPLLLIPGVGLLVLSTAARFGQLHQELHRHQGEGASIAVEHLRQRARLLHSSLLSQYVSIAILAFSSLMGTLANRWLPSVAWVAELTTFLGVVAIAFSAMQLIREARHLLNVIEDDAQAL